MVEGLKHFIFDVLALGAIVSIAYGLSQIYAPSVYVFIGFVLGWIAFKGASRMRTK